MREWSMHRMLARFGLAHLRTRHAQFFINGKLQGLYSFVEAPAQKYVFQRSFPKFDPSNYSLYKFKTMSIGCGGYSADEIAKAPVSDNTTTYAFERGTHRKKISVLGIDKADKCYWEFITMIMREKVDTVSAWKRYEKDCGKTMVETGLVDRDLGVKATEVEMQSFINSFMVHKRATCAAGWGGDHCNIKLSDPVCEPSPSACTENGGQDTDCCSTCKGGGCNSGYTYAGQVALDKTTLNSRFPAWYKGCSELFCGNTCCVKDQYWDANRLQALTNSSDCFGGDTGTCENIELESAVDVENWLKNFAVRVQFSLP